MAGSALADGMTKVADLMITSTLIRATPVNAPVSGGYMIVKNMGTEPDRIIGADANFAGKTEVHEMKMDGDVMKMREVEGINISPGEEVKLMPGGYHLMFMQLGQQLTPGEKLSVTVEFEKAGAVELDFVVEDLPTIRQAMGATGHTMN